MATPQGHREGYRRLIAGPGWPTLTRPELAVPLAGRDDRRTPLAAFAQFTDLHIADAQSPARLEFLVRYVASALFRPHETLGTRAASALVSRINAMVDQAPITGASLGFVMVTGDSTDNHEHIELDWYLTVLSGGLLHPDSGDPCRYEGVQNSGISLYWNPEVPTGDSYKDVGFPTIPGFLERANSEFYAPGLRVPWYATFGNHDDSALGYLPSDVRELEAVYTGNRKLEAASSTAEEMRLLQLLKTDPRAAAKAIGHLDGTVRRVTPDPRRRPFTPGEFVAAHFDPRVAGAGPLGHGFTARNLATNTAYYTFTVAPGITGISMDTTNRAGQMNGSLGTAQLNWLESTLRDGHSRYYDADGRLQRHDRSDHYFILFSHQTAGTMDNLLADPARPNEKRHSGDEVVALIHRFPNVLVWVNGHTHTNTITPHPGPSPDRSFWEITTASHVDYPVHGRIIEVADNHDGTLSVFTTIIEAEGPYQADYDKTDIGSLTALYRELALNDRGAVASRMGEATDHNTELVLCNPLGG